MSEKNNLYLMQAEYRAAKRMKTLNGANFFTFKKDIYVYGHPYRGEDANMNYGDMILVNEKYIIPANFCKKLTDQEREYVESTMPKPAQTANQTSIVDTEPEPQATVETLNEQGKEAVLESTEKLKTMSLSKIANLKNSYTSTGVMFGAVGGVMLAVYLHKGFWISTGIVLGFTALGGFAGSRFQKKQEKKAATEQPNSLIV